MATAARKPYLKLSIEKRLALIEELWNSVQKELQVGYPAAPVSSSERAELDQLIEETDLGAELVDLETACREIQLELKTASRKRSKR